MLGRCKDGFDMQEDFSLIVVIIYQGIDQGSKGVGRIWGLMEWKTSRIGEQANNQNVFIDQTGETQTQT